MSFTFGHTHAGKVGTKSPPFPLGLRGREGWRGEEKLERFATWLLAPEAGFWPAENWLLALRNGAMGSTYITPKEGSGTRYVS